MEKFLVLILVLIGERQVQAYGTPEIIQSLGYPLQTIEAETEDGYILAIHRIPFGKNENPKDCKKKPVVFLQHGLEATSSNFVTSLPNKSLGFMLADNGFDVWMGNMRGNDYSKKHKIYSTSQSKFWEFSWYEMMKYDLTAMIDTALKTTNQSQLYYIGHSQGTLTMFSKLSSESDFGKKIKKFFALAPIGRVKYIRGLLSFLAKYFPWSTELMERFFGIHEFAPDNYLSEIAKKILCHGHLSSLCENFILMMVGPESEQINKERLPIYLVDLPGGTSVRNVLNWMQMVNSGKIQAFDWGTKKENLKFYGKESPPTFDYSTIDTDMYLYWSEDDWLADKSDIEEYLLEALKPERIMANNKLDKFNHMDFLWGDNAAKFIYYPIIDILKNDS